MKTFEVLVRQQRYAVNSDQVLVVECGQDGCAVIHFCEPRRAALETSTPYAQALQQWKES